jgi:hypothetical protein
MQSPQLTVSRHRLADRPCVLAHGELVVQPSTSLRRVASLCSA